MPHKIKEQIEIFEEGDFQRLNPSFLTESQEIINPGSILDSTRVDRKIVWQPFFTKYVISLTWEQFSDASTGKTINIFKLPELGEVISAFVIIDEIFDGGAISAYTIEIGRTSDTDCFITASDAQTTGVAAAKGVAFTSSGSIFSDTSNTQIVARAVSTSANLNAATSGRARVIMTCIQHGE